MDDHVQDFLGEVELGLDARQFYESKLGQEILRRAQEKMLNAIEKWKKSDPENSIQQRELLMEVKVAELFPQWFGELMQKGRSAEGVLTQDME